MTYQIFLSGKLIRLIGELMGFSGEHCGSVSCGCNCHLCIRSKSRPSDSAERKQARGEGFKLLWACEDHLALVTCSECEGSGCRRLSHRDVLKTSEYESRGAAEPPHKDIETFTLHPVV